MKKTIFLILLFLLVFSSISLAEESRWQQLGNEPYFSYLDKDSIQKSQPNIISCWIKVIPPENKIQQFKDMLKGIHPKHKGEAENAAYFMTHILFNINNNTVTCTEDVVLNAEGISLYSENYNDKWDSIRPESKFEKAMNLAKELIKSK